MRNLAGSRCGRGGPELACAFPEPEQLHTNKSGSKLRARQKIRCAFWRERRAGRCKAPRRRRCGDIVEERQRRRCPPAAAPLRAAARRPAGGVARSLHTAPGMLVARALPAGLGASSKMYTLFPDGPLASCRTPKSTVDHSFGCGWAAECNRELLPRRWDH